MHTSVVQWLDKAKGRGATGFKLTGTVDVIPFASVLRTGALCAVQEACSGPGVTYTPLTETQIQSLQQSRAEVEARATTAATDIEDVVHNLLDVSGMSMFGDFS